MKITIVKFVLKVQLTANISRNGNNFNSSRSVGSENQDVIAIPLSGCDFNRESDNCIRNLHHTITLPELRKLVDNCQSTLCAQDRDPKRGGL